MKFLLSYQLKRFQLKYFEQTHLSDDHKQLLDEVFEIMSRIIKVEVGVKFIERNKKTVMFLLLR